VRPRSVDWYRLTVAWTSSALIVGVLLAIGRRIVPDVLDLVRRTGHDPDVVATALLAGAFALWWAGVRHLGPVAASPAQQRWEVWRDAKAWQARRRRRSLLSAVPVAAGAGYVVGLAVDAWLPGAVTLLVLVVSAWLIALGQRRDGGPGVAALLGATALGLLSDSAWGPAWGGVIGGLAAVLTVRPRRPRSHRLVPRWNLAAAAQRRWTLGAAATMLDVELLRAGPSPAIGRRFPFSLPSSPLARLAVLTGWRAFRPTVIRAAPGFVIVAAVAEVLGEQAGLLGAVLVLHTLTVATTRDLLAWNEMEAVQRMVAVDPHVALRALAMPCAASTIAVVVFVAVVLTPPWPALVVLVLLPVLATWSRIRAAEEPEELTMASTPMGAVPIQVVGRVVAGVAATALALVVLGSI